MVCDESIKQAKLREIGVTTSDAKAVEERVSRHLQSGSRQFDTAREILRAEIMDPGRQEFTYGLQLWPEFEFTVVGDRGHWHSARFVRAAGHSGPTARQPEDLEVWSATIAELEALFGPLQDGDHWPPYEEFIFEDADGGKYGAGFSFGLLQKIQRL
ncbi:hypothetical protein GCM10027089_24620 [Nocardia thraciensis]